jgi:hypothetical protein
MNTDIDVICVYLCSSVVPKLCRAGKRLKVSVTDRINIRVHLCPSVVPLFQRIPPRGADFLAHRDDVFGRHVGLDAMDGGRDVSAAGRQVPDPTPDFVPDLLRRAVGQDPLRVDRAAERQPIAELLLQPRRVPHHAGRDLHGIEQVHADLDQVADQRIDVAARMEKDLGPGMRPDA